MSAFQVSPNHIGALVKWYLTASPDYLRANWRGQRPNRNDADAMMKSLALENAKSVNHRYQNDLAEPVACQDRLSAYKLLTPVQVIKAVDGLSYQSNEHDEWDKSEARHLLDTIKSAAIAQLPGYREAEWAIE